jgi:hypothetical protein
MIRKRLCNYPSCEVYFTPRSHNQRYCGSIRLKIGCAYRNRLELNKRYTEANNRYFRKWRLRNQERLNAKRRTEEYHEKVRLHKQMMAEIFFKRYGVIPKRENLTWKNLKRYKNTEKITINGNY